MSAQSGSEEKAKAVTNEISDNKTSENTENTNANGSTNTSPANVRKARLSGRRNQMPSKRIAQKANLEKKENTDLNQVSSSNPPQNETVTSSDNVISSVNETNKINNSQVSSDTNVSTSSATKTTNVWEARRQSKKAEPQTASTQGPGSVQSQQLPSQSQQQQTSFQSQSKLTNASPTKYMAVKRDPTAVEPSKKPLPPVEQAKVTSPTTTETTSKMSKPAIENEAPATAPTTSTSRFAHTSGYRPPHQRGDNAVVVKPPEESESKRDRSSGGYSFRERTRPTNTGSENVRRPNVGGKLGGYDRKASDNPSENETGNTGRKFESNERPQRNKDFKNRIDIDRERENETQRDRIPESGQMNFRNNKLDPRSERNPNISRTRSEGQFKRDSSSIAKDNIPASNLKNVVRSHSLQNEKLKESLSRVNQSVPQRTFSAPKEQLVKAVKLPGSIQQKDDKIMKIKEQVKAKAPTTATSVGGLQPVLTSAQEALRVISDGDVEITRENAEMVQRELNTTLNPLGPEFAPQEAIPDGDLALDQSNYVVDQNQYQSEQIPVYDAANIVRHGEGMEDMQNLSWSFAPSDSQVYAQDFGVEAEYDMHHYPEFERNHEMGVDPNLGGPNNANMGGASLPPNGNLGGPPSQSPEHVSTSHPINEAYNTQSTVTMAAQPMPGTTPGSGPLSNILSASFNPSHTDDLSNQQTTEAQQVKLKAQQAIQQNPQMFTGDYNTNAPAMVAVNSLWRYPQFGPVGDHTQMWTSPEEQQQQQQQQQQMYFMWQQQQRMNATPQPPQNNQPVYVTNYPMSSQNDNNFSSRRQWNQRSRGGQNRRYRGRGRGRFDHRFDGNNNDSTNQRNEMDSNISGNQSSIGRGKYNERQYSKKRYGQKRGHGNYRTKEHDYSQTNDNNENINGGKGKSHELNPQSNPWNNMSGDYGYSYDGQNEEMMGKFETETMQTDKGGNQKEENHFPSDFETLTLSDWYFMIENFSAQRVETFQKQLFETNPPPSLKTFRLELPSSPIQPGWVDRVKWSQLSDYLSQAKLDSVEIASHLQTKLDVYNEKDFQELEPVAKFITSLKCRRFVLEHAPCRVTPEFVRSLPNEIEEARFLCPSIEWSEPLVKSFGPKLNYLALLCPNTTMTISDFLDALEGKVNRLYLCNDESSSRRLSSQEVIKLFENVLHLELDDSLLTEIHPMGDGRVSKTQTLTIHLKDKMLQKDFYAKYSFPKSITNFLVCPVDPSRMLKGWNNTNTSVNTSSSTTTSKNFVRQGNADDEIKFDVQQHKQQRQMQTGNIKSKEQQQYQQQYQHQQQQPQGSLDGVSTMEDNKTLSNDATPEQNQNTGKKMSFKEKLQNAGKVPKKSSTLRIETNQ